MAKENIQRRVHWYGVDENTVRWLGLVVLIVLGLIAVGGAYRQWDQRSLQRRATETLERARGLLLMVREEAGGSRDQQAAFREAAKTLEEARGAWSREEYDVVLSKAEVGQGLLVTILDEIRNPGRGGEARFIYVEGEVDLRRGDTGTFRRARPRDVLYEGDYVRSSSRGSAEILFGRDGTLFTVRPDTLLKVNRTQQYGSLPQSVGVQYGWVDLSTTFQEGEVETGFAQMTVANETDASVSLGRDSEETLFAVERGSARVAATESGDVLDLADREQVRHGAEGFSRKDSLPATPGLEEPPNDFDVNLDRRREISLVWSQVPDARGGYALQVSRNRLFTDNLIDIEARRTNHARLGISDEGAFYWRVASLNSNGDLGAWSDTQRFRVLSTGGVFWEDQEAPVLDLQEIYVNGRILIVKGLTEPGVTLMVGDRQIPVNADGSFSRSISHAGLGLVTVSVTAIDVAGNQTVESREVLIEDF